MVDSKVLFNDKDIGWIEQVEQYRQSVKEYKKSFKELNIIMIKHVKYDLLKSQCFLRRLFLNDDSQIEIKLPDELAAIGISSIVYSGKDLNRVVVYYTAKTLMVDYSVVLKTLDDYIASHKNKVDEYLYLDIKYMESDEYIDNMDYITYLMLTYPLINIDNSTNVITHNDKDLLIGYGDCLGNMICNFNYLHDRLGLSKNYLAYFKDPKEFCTGSELYSMSTTNVVYYIKKVANTSILKNFLKFLLGNEKLSDLYFMLDLGTRDNMYEQYYCKLSDILNELQAKGIYVKLIINGRLCHR